jgi:hypothetical protein
MENALPGGGAFFLSHLMQSMKTGWRRMKGWWERALPAIEHAVGTIRWQGPLPHSMLGHKWERLY